MNNTYRLKAENNWYKNNSKKYYITLGIGKYSKNYVSCIPLGTALKTELVTTTSEVKKILHSRLIKVNGKVITSINYPLAVLDLVQYNSQLYRVTLDKKYHLVKTTSTLVYHRCKSKTLLKKNSLQLNCLDGYNQLISSEILSSISEPIQNYVLVKDLHTQEFKIVHISEFNCLNIIKGKFHNRSFTQYTIDQDTVRINEHIVNLNYCVFSYANN